ncbi:hypothetical protein [Shewanella donghaensis]|uniref:hypothetical protein n=1 Tax=Shewanella donghaensis TaxID=238836 RepID=UPI001D053D3C|nr:hypothetical protein [Shewanella donghaensis]
MTIKTSNPIKRFYSLVCLGAVFLSVDCYSNEVPLTKADIHRIEYPSGIQFMSSIISSDESIVLVYEHFDDYD